MESFLKVFSDHLSWLQCNRNQPICQSRALGIGNQAWHISTSLRDDLDSERTIAGRFLGGSGGSNLCLSNKQRGRSGMDVYLIYGDPNAKSTRNSLLLKLIKPL